MDTATHQLLSSAMIGTGATLVMDAWTLVRRALLGTPLPDYRLVGRWLGHMGHGRFRHQRIAAALPVPGELWIGWTAHYVVGMAFAALLLAIWTTEWARHPTIVPALIVGIGSVAAPFLVMQPAMGAGIAASRTPRPAAARVQSLATHAVFGVGLYAAAALLNRINFYL
jgi:Protein of unknown function (DUF2938)